MPELPEVETVVKGLSPHMQSQIIDFVELRRPNLRYAFASNLKQVCESAHILSIFRKAKYIIIRLDTGYSLIAHLGMSGTYTVYPRGHNAPYAKHDHIIFHMNSGEKIIYNDPRRFGFLLCIPTDDEDTEPHLSKLALDPTNPDCTAQYFYNNICNRTGTLKSCLLNQSIIAGLGNIYVCESLWRAKLSPFSVAKDIDKQSLYILWGHIKDVIDEAILAGGSSLKDYRNTDGKMGYFQHNFAVYDREKNSCNACNTTIVRAVQNGRSTFYCPECQS